MQVPRAEPFEVDVVARCSGADLAGFRAADDALARFVTALHAAPRSAQKAAPRRVFLPVPLPNRTFELRYRVDLDAMASAYEEIDVAQRFGRSLLAPASSFLLRPEPDPNGAPVRVTFDPPELVATGLRRKDGAYVLETHELRVATYTAFGPRTARTFSIEEGSVHFVQLDGALDAGFEGVAEWVERSARAVRDFYGRAPDREITVLLGPLPGRRGVPFGKLLPESGPGIVVLAGENTSRAELYRDWVLVHELFHVGSPSFQGEGKWFDEGLATYFEPIIRARAGFIGERDVWREFLESMRRGLPALTEHGLENAKGFGDLYWGGAVFCLLADVEIRRRSSGRKGLEDGVRAVLAAGGFASEVWPFARALAVADSVYGAPLLANLAERHATSGAPFDLDALFAALGVSLGTQGDVRFDDAAPLASVRRAIVGTERVPAPR